MLILTRRVGEAILMDGGVRVVVLGVDGSGVRLGIEAPPSVGILREEVVQRIAEENIRAGSTEDGKAILRRLTGNPVAEVAPEEAPSSPKTEAEDESPTP
jgi:carbon storage regulator